MPLYTIRIFKSLGTRDPERRWVNNYEVLSDASDVTGIRTIAAAIVTAEKALHLTSVQFLSQTLSSYVIEGPAYDPTSFVTDELSGTGTQADGGADILDSNVCLQMQFNAVLGRQGRRFYRGVLTEADVTVGSSGKFGLVGGNRYATGGSAYTSFRNALLPYFAAAAPATRLVMAGLFKDATIINVRDVTNVTTGGVVVNRRNHRYFDRGPAG